jgi:hypothetical protein
MNSKRNWSPRSSSRLCACLGISFLAGCAALDTHQAKLDQKQLRDVLMDYTDEQILDNLIRASHGLPIVHFDLSNITGSVTSKLTPTAGGGHVVTSVKSRTPTSSTVTTDQTTSGTGAAVVNTIVKSFSVVGGVVDTIARPFSWGITAERDNAISVQADPLLDDPKVYEAYIKFLNTDVLPKKSSSAEINKDTELTKTTATTTKPTSVRKMVVTQPSAPSSPAPGATASSVTTTETTEFAATSSTTEESKPETKPSPKVDLVIESFDSIQSLRKSPTAPRLADVLVGPKRWRDGMYYWVPQRYQKQFFALCMATVARGVASEGATEKGTDAVKALKENSAILRRQELK